MRSNAALAHVTLTSAVLLAIASSGAAPAFGAAVGMHRPSAFSPQSPTVMSFSRGSIVPFQGKLFDGRSVSVDRTGAVRITTTVGNRSISERRTLSSTQRPAFGVGATPADRARALFDLARPLPAAYAKHSVIVVFKDGTTIPSDRLSVPEKTLRAMRGFRGGHVPSTFSVPHYTTDSRVDALFAKFGVSHTERLFAGVARGTLAQSAARAGSRSRVPVLNIGNAFRITVTNAQLSTALRDLAKMPTVAYAGHDYFVASTAVPGATIPASMIAEARAMHPRRAFGRSAGVGHPGRATLSIGGPSTPALDNFMVTSSGQAFLNSPGVDAIAAFDEIAKNFPGQLPGTGVTVTNVSLGDLDDASAGTNPADPCHSFVGSFGPTTHMIGGQRYLDLPSLPLIPAYVASPSGLLSATAETCGIDPFLEEVSLDFAVMAPLPHALQRSGEVGDALGDLLGIAPGASYRLVVPATNDSPTILGALIGAATQSPAPDVITMSIGYGFDRFGFPSRYFEDDALARSVIATITSSYNVPVFIAANDGTRSSIGAPIGPSGGSAPTNVAPPSAAFTTLDDIALTTVASSIPDTGAIDVGGTTLDDVASANPQDPASGPLANAHAFPVTRFNGFDVFSSGFGSRVNVSAPADNIVSFVRFGANFDSTVLNVTGGTSASAPEAAAVAAIAIQVAKLEGHPFTSPGALRSFLAATGTAPARSRVSDIPLNVGPQVSARRAVEALLASAHVTVSPGVARVAIQQRKVNCDESFCAFPSLFEFVDPAIVSLRLPRASDGTFTGARTNDYLTIAPDWEGLPANAGYRLTIAGKPNAVLSTAPFARILPAQIFAAAGIPLASTGIRTISLTYQSTIGLHVAAQTTFDITFGPADGTSTNVFAPVVPPVVTGDTMPVTYDVSMLPQGIGPVYLTITTPGRFDGFTRLVFLYKLPSAKGVVPVPVSALVGNGVYPIGLGYGGARPSSNPMYLSPLSYSRVVTAGSLRPPAPVLSAASSIPGHSLEVAYAQPISIGWDVSSVPGATGAIAEVSFGSPTLFGNYNTFNNPNGGEIDANGVDSASVYHQPLSGITGTMTIDPRKLNVFPGVFHSVRVLATNGTVIGEASDASAFMMDGVAAPDGGTIYAYGLNTSGTDGFLMSVQEGCISNTLVFQYFGSVGIGTSFGANAMTFDQKTLQITNPAATFTTSSCNSQPMLLGNDTGFYYDRDGHGFATLPAVSSPSPAPQYLAFPPSAVPNDPVVAGGPFPPLAKMQSILFETPQNYIGGDDTSTRASFLGINTFGAGTHNQATAFSMDVSTGVASPVITIDDFDSLTFPQVLGTGYDVSRNMAYSIVNDTQNENIPAMVLETDYTTGKHAVFSTMGDPPGFSAVGENLAAIDPTTHKMVFVTSSVSADVPQFHIIDLVTHAISLVKPPHYGLGSDPSNVLCDPVNHLFIVLEFHQLADQANELTPSGIDFFDEAGNFLKHITTPFSYLPYLGGDGPGQQLTFVNGNLRRLFVAAPPSFNGIYEPQLMVFDY